jgi:hypothetical protein
MKKYLLLFMMLLLTAAASAQPVMTRRTIAAGGGGGSSLYNWVQFADTDLGTWPTTATHIQKSLTIGTADNRGLISFVRGQSIQGNSWKWWIDSVVWIQGSARQRFTKVDSVFTNGSAWTGDGEYVFKLASPNSGTGEVRAYIKDNNQFLLLAVAEIDGVHSDVVRASGKNTGNYSQPMTCSVTTVAGDSTICLGNVDGPVITGHGSSETVRFNNTYQILTTKPATTTTTSFSEPLSGTSNLWYMLAVSIKPASQVPAFAGDSLRVIAFAGNPTWATYFTVSNNSNRFMMVQDGGVFTGAGWAKYDSVKYGSQKFTLIDSAGSPSFGGGRRDLWGLIAPTVGSDSIRFYSSQSQMWNSAIVTVWKNVNQTTPFTDANKTWTQNNWGTSVGPTNVTSATGGLVVSIFTSVVSGDWAPTAGDSQTTLMTMTGNSSHTAGVATKAGAATVAISWSVNANATIGMWGIPLNAQ